MDRNGPTDGRLTGGTEGQRKGERGDKGESGEEGVLKRVEQLVSLFPNHRATNFPFLQVDYPTIRVIAILSNQVVDDFFVPEQGNPYCLSFLLSDLGIFANGHDESTYMYDTLIEVCHDREGLV